MTTVSRSTTAARSSPASESLARAFGLAFPPNIALEIAMRVEDGDDAKERMIRQAVSEAHWRYRAARVVALLSRHSRGGPADPPLGPRSGLSAGHALTLALFAAGWSIDEIGSMFESSTERVSRDLAEARRRLLHDRAPESCLDHRQLASRTDDSALTLHERMTLRAHLRVCRGCREATRRFESLDNELGRQAAAFDLDVEPGARPLRLISSLHRARFVLAGTLALVLIVSVATAVAGFDRALGNNGAPVVLVPASDAPRFSGWLVTSTVDGLAAINMATREHRMIAGAPREGNQPPITLLSPDGRLVAQWRFHEGQRVTTSLQLMTLSGEDLGAWHWDRSNSPGRLTAWLDNRELLFVKPPAQQTGESTQDFVLRQSACNQLVALDIETRRFRVLHTGSVGVATTSPDSRHIAILGIYDYSEEAKHGRSLEVRRVVDGGLSEPVNTTGIRYPLEGTRPIWSSDSSVLYFTTLDIDAGTNPGNGRRGDRVDIAMLDLDGNLRLLTDNVEHERMRLLGVSPDMTEFLYLKSLSTSPPVIWNLWRGYVDGQSPELLAEDVAAPFFYSATATWLPDGQTAIVNESRSHFLTGVHNPRAIPVGSTRFLAITSESVAPVTTQLGVWGIDAWGEQILRWLPEDALEPSEPAESHEISMAGSFSPPRTIVGDFASHVTAPWSLLSPTGAYSLYEHRAIATPIIWSETARNARILSGDLPPSDLSWTGSGDAVFAVQNDVQFGSRMVLYAARTSRVANFYDFRALDPAGVSGNHDLRYAAPRLSADGNTASYVVVDEANRRATLWVASMTSGHLEAFSWEWPEDTLVAQAVIAIWTSPETLLATVPARWEDGYPTEIDLVQIRTGHIKAGIVDAERLMTIRVPGADRGVTIEELAISPDREHVAIRIRSYGSLDPLRQRQDMVVVLSSSDGRQQIELTRGQIGSGLAWSPDSDWIAFGTRDRVAVARADGRDFAFISTDGVRARDPMWGLSGVIHYTTGPPGQRAELVEVVAR